MDSKKREEIAEKLKERGAVLPCPRCGNTGFSVIDGYFSHTLQNELTGIVLGGPSVPTAVVGCNRCGFLSEHALGALDLLPSSTPAKETQNGK